MIDLHSSNLVRTGLLIAIGAVILMLLIRWNQFQEQRQPEMATNTVLSSPGAEVPAASEPVPSAADNTDVPEVPAAEPEPIATQQLVAQRSQQVHVVTDTMDVLIDTLGGDIVKVALLKHATNLGEKDNPFILLNQNESQIYVAQSGLIGNNGTDQSGGVRPVFQVENTSYSLGADQDTLQVDLTLQQNGVDITKRFIFHRNDYLVDIQYLINNQSDTDWSARLYGQIKRDDHNPVVSSGGFFQPPNYYGAAITSPDKPYTKIDFEDIAKGEFETFNQTGGWIAMIQHYFVSAWIPQAEQQNRFSMTKLGNTNQYLLRFIGPNQTLRPGQQTTISSQFYAGPKDVKRLEEISPHLEKTVDFGWLFFLSKPLFLFLHWIHSYVGNWGWAIVILVLCMKAAFFHLSAAGFRSMAKMKKFAPKMAELKERYGDNRQKYSEEMMKLYKKEKVNPMGGCLPMLVQMPVFLALYWVLLESVELRHAPFIFWINDLSSKDPYFILPILYAGTFFLQQRLSPTPADPNYARIMQLMPFMFGFLFLFFDSGLVLYWLVNGMLSIAQQYVITRQIEKADAKTGA